MNNIAYLNITKELIILLPDNLYFNVYEVSLIKSNKNNIVNVSDNIFTYLQKNRSLYILSEYINTIGNNIFIELMDDYFLFDKDIICISQNYIKHIAYNENLIQYNNKNDFFNNYYINIDNKYYVPNKQTLSNHIFDFKEKSYTCIMINKNNLNEYFYTIKTKPSNIFDLYNSSFQIEDPIYKLIIENDQEDKNYYRVIQPLFFDYKINLNYNQSIYEINNSELFSNIIDLFFKFLPIKIPKNKILNKNLLTIDDIISENINPQKLSVYDPQIASLDVKNFDQTIINYQTKLYTDEIYNFIINENYDIYHNLYKLILLNNYHLNKYIYIYKENKEHILNELGNDEYSKNFKILIEYFDNIYHLIKRVQKFSSENFKKNLNSNNIKEDFINFISINIPNSDKLIETIKNINF